MGDGTSVRRVRCYGLRLEVGEPLETLEERLCERLGVDPVDIDGWELLRRSLDARGRRAPRYEHAVGVTLKAGAKTDPEAKAAPWTVRHHTIRVPTGVMAKPLVIGAGPAGLFAALRLAGYGFKPLILERGKPVEERVRDVSAYWKRGELDPESNVQFGEGGAGTYSDGKLTSRSKDFRKRWVLEQLVTAGAAPAILYEAHPHLGTDRLRTLVANIRARLEAHGARFRFGSRVESLSLRDERAAGVVVAVEGGEEEIAGAPVFLGVGHSARELVKRLEGQGVGLSAKGFAVGARVELPQASVDRRQYGRWIDELTLPPAEFALASRTGEGRGVFSFCMCPGGTVIPAASNGEGLVVNGMSGSKRSGRFANAALVAQMQPEDVGGDPWTGVALQRRWEARAQELAGFRALPAQTVASFLGKTRGDGLPSAHSSPWPLAGVALADCLPDFVAAALRETLPGMINKMPGLGEGLLIGVETRTSSPFRIDRSETMESVTLPGLYPIGEGAGYAGGIVSSAIDGARAVDAWVESLGGVVEMKTF